MTKVLPSQNNSINYKNSMIVLVVLFLAFTAVYQLRTFLDDSQFMWISVFSYVVGPGAMALISSFLAIKLFRKNHFQAKAVLFFALGATCRLLAEQIWAFYDHVLDADPFPSEADIFFIAAYPFFALFLFYSLKPIIKNVSKNTWIFAIILSFSILLPSLIASYDDIAGDESFSVSIALSYPIMSSIQLVPAIIGIFFLSKEGSSFSWMLILFGFIVELVSDTLFLFVELDGTYFDGHPVDLIFMYSFILLAYGMFLKLKLENFDISETTEYFNENIKFETITKYGIPLTLIITCLVIGIFIFHVILSEENKDSKIFDLFLLVISIIGIFVLITLILNKHVSKLVKMRTHELEVQKNTLENLVEEKTRELLKQERLSAIGELSGRVAHDLRNPLSVIKLTVELLKKQPSNKKLSDSDIQTRLDTINNNILRISHQVDDVLGYVRHSPLRLSNTSVCGIIKTSIEKINIPSNVQIVMPENDVNINCDPIKIDAVFINFLINSIQAMSDGGGKITINISENQDKVKLEFSDTGSGIPEDVIDNVFEPLFTTKQKGTGLGLASCKNIIEQHHGTISVKNNPTTFTIEIPKLLPKENKTET